MNILWVEDFGTNWIARERALSGNRGDVIFFGDQVRGDFATATKTPLAAM